MGRRISSHICILRTCIFCATAKSELTLLVLPSFRRLRPKQNYGILVFSIFGIAPSLSLSLFRITLPQAMLHRDRSVQTAHLPCCFCCNHASLFHTNTQHNTQHMYVEKFKIKFTTLGLAISFLLQCFWKSTFFSQLGVALQSLLSDPALPCLQVEPFIATWFLPIAQVTEPLLLQCPFDKLWCEVSLLCSVALRHIQECGF